MPRSPESRARVREGVGHRLSAAIGRGGVSLQAGRRTFVAAARAVRAAPLRLAGVAAALLLAESLYEGFSAADLQAVIARANIGYYDEGEILWALLGSVVSPLPLSLGGGEARAALARRYFALQAGADARPVGLLPLFLLELGVTVLVVASGVLGATPGLAVVLAASLHDAPQVLLLGFLGAFVGALATMAYVIPGIAFATRMVVLSGQPPHAALRASWAWARGRRSRLVPLLVASYSTELLGLGGVLLFGVGLVATMPLARAFRDTLLTRIYLELGGATSSQARREHASVFRA
jgi:hypothetical protein